MDKNKIISAAEYALRALLDAGADMAAVGGSAGRFAEFNIDGGEFSLLRTIFNEGISVTAYIGGRKGSASTNALDRASVDSAVADAVAAARSAMPDDAWAIAPEAPPREFRSGCADCDMDGFFDAVLALKSDIARDYPRILLEQLVAAHRFVQSVFLNSNGVRYVSESGCYDVDLMFSAHEGDRSSSFFSSGARFTDLSAPLIELGSIRADLDSVSRQLDTVTFDGKFTGTLLLTPASLEEMIGMALDNFTEDTVIIEGTSPWKDKLGAQVADGRLTVSLRPLDSEIVCGERVTDDGFISENFNIIENGVLKQFPLSLYAANKTGFDRAPNTSGALVIPAGDTPLDELIAGIDRGLLLGRFSGGQPGTNGDFSGVAKNSFFIENGRITDAVSEIMVNGNLADMLMHLRGISAERVADGGTVLPYAAFDGITVSGK